MIIDAFSIRTGHGIERYNKELLRAIDEINPNIRITVIYGSKHDLMGLENLNEGVIGPANENFIPIRDNISFLYRLSGMDFDVFHTTRSTGPLYSFPGKKVIRTVHDLGRKYSGTERKGVKTRLYKEVAEGRALSNSDRIVTVSDNTKEDILYHYDIKRSKVMTIPNGISKKFKRKEAEKLEGTKEKYGLQDKFVLNVGAISPRKNTRRLATAWENSEVSEEYSLVIAGGTGDRGEEIKEEIKGPSNISLVGYVPEDDLVNLYNLADLFVFPSLFEGFGFPPLEAMACGTPVIASNTSSLPEVVGDAGINVNPKDTIELSESINRVLKNEELKNKLMTKGIDRAAEFSWKQTAKSILTCYKDLI
ncbi:glycosyltransferase family 4 protein [Halosimplex pelagicum]|uniref:Glycosyltransferase family 4 protein n=1 Tax=Halosimplex pelagicum TaxID=869886 RepID=A0A7D5P5H3_9EURY|nr:glycosyltransferase family 1 protein [Halosimplex pelagicum]QLH81266.1 glycosyltransferase family 4 protein [Halosimplex pelagicum]